MMCPVDTSCTDVSAATPAPAHASLQSQWSCCLCPPLPPSGGSREQNSTYPSSLLIFSVAAVRSQYLLKTAVSVSCFGCQFFFRQLLILAVNSFHSINRGCTPSIQHSSHREQGCKQEFIECKPSIQQRSHREPGCTPSIQHRSHREQGCKQEFIECKPSIHIRNKAF